MQEKVKSYIAHHKLVEKSDKIALAISGGKDSVCAAHILEELEVPFVMVHVNFQLRGEESDGDQQFVSELASQLAYCEALFVNRVDTKLYTKKHGLSTQEAARELRYNYFKELKGRGVFTKLITAHHASDNFETFFINLYRTSGIKGLTGIPKVRDYLIRPFLGITRMEIDSYVTENKIAYREDRSNKESKYLRNKIRNNVIPNIKIEIADFEERALKSVEYISEESELLDFFIKEKVDSLVSSDSDRENIAIAALLSYPQSHVILYRILDKYGFSVSQCKQIMDVADEGSGKVFEAESVQLIVDRENLIVTRKSADLFSPYEIDSEGSGEYLNPAISVKRVKEVVFTSDKHQETVELTPDFFPLQVRTWQRGDRFQPLGMKGSKLLSDFFIDEKVDVLTKNSLPLLCKDDEVLWVPGYRISEKVKVKENTHLFELKFQKFKVD